jgi:anti-sigma factor RsiW
MKMSGCKQWESALHDYLEELLPPELAERVETHLDSCPGCRQTMAEWDKVGQLLAELPVLPAPIMHVQMAVPERKPLFQPAQVAALWVGIALPGAWILQQLASSFHWQSGWIRDWASPTLNMPQWLDSLRHWAEQFMS